MNSGQWAVGGGQSEQCSREDAKMRRNKTKSPPIRKKPEAFDPDIKTCDFKMGDIGHGMEVAVCWSTKILQPVGFVFGFGMAGLKKYTFYVIGSYVIPGCRRHGVRTAINNWLLKTYQVIETKQGTTEGAAFMKKFGYRYDFDRDSWVYVKPK